MWVKFWVGIRSGFLARMMTARKWGRKMVDKNSEGGKIDIMDRMMNILTLPY